MAFMRFWNIAACLLVMSCGDDGTGGAGAGGAGSSDGAGTPDGGNPGQGGGGGPAGGGDQGGSGGGVVHTNCTDQCRYVRSGATGDGSGSDWENAATGLPAGLERGLVYFVGAGNYPSGALNSSDSSTELIAIRRATQEDHGTETGWEPSFAEGTAEFGPLVLEAPFLELDGRGATRIVGSFQSTVVDIPAANVTLRGCDVDGNFQRTDGQHTDGACAGMSVSGDNVVVADNRIHDAADDGVFMGDATGISFVGNTVHSLHGCGTDGGCGPCYNGHSDGLELFNLKQSEIAGNTLYGIASTSAIFFGNWADELGDGPSQYCEDILLVNNLIYNPETGFVAYLEDVRGVQVYNNVFWGLHQGAYGGLSVGEHVAGLELYNNAILSINYAHIGGSYDPAEHHGDYNLFGLSLGQWQDGEHDVVASDPAFFGLPDIDGTLLDPPTPEDFAPAAGSPLIDAGYAGDAAIMIPAADFFGTDRDDTPNIGAIE